MNLLLKQFPHIVGLLDSKDDEIIHEAILALAAIGSASAAASDRLVTILDESVQNQNEVESRLHYAVAYCLGRIGSPGAMKALPRLKELSEFLRSHAGNCCDLGSAADHTK